MDRRTVTVAHGIVRIDQRIHVPRTGIGTDVSGPACIFARVDVTKGSIAYLQDDADIAAPRRFVIVLPPFTVAQASLRQCHATTTGVAFRPSSTHALPSQPLLFPAAADRLPRCEADLLRYLADAAPAMTIGRARDPLLPASRAKTILDTEYAAPLTIASVARRLRVSSAMLSRIFKRTYGMPPVWYRHHLRVMDALLRLAEGGAPADVSGHVGFDDLGRFYKVLRKVGCAAPGTYRPARSKNAKT